MRRAFRPLTLAAGRPCRPARVWFSPKVRQFGARHASTLPAVEDEAPPAEHRRTASTYAALIDRNKDAERGSAANVASLFDDMARDGIELDSAIGHAAIRALAAHPDPLLLASILSAMREKWLYVDEVGLHDIAAGQIKNGQLEEALERIEDMIASRVQIRPWLSDMAVFALCDRSDVDGALGLLQDRVRTREKGISPATWYQVFDTACSVLHYDAISFVWKHQVDLHYLNPSSGQCLAVLHAAARHADISLASSVFRVLDTRATATQLSSIHYELLIEAYLQANDISTVLSILCIMNETGTEPNRSTTRALYIALISQGPEQIHDAFDTLRSLHAERPDRVIPIAIMDTILEATLYSDEDATEQQQQQQQQSASAASTTKPQLDLAIERYKAARELCSKGPTVDTFNILLSRCAALPGTKAKTMFLASEMLAHRVDPNAATYDHLLLVCLADAARLRRLAAAPGAAPRVAQAADASFADAFRYYQEMCGRGWTPRVGTFERMVMACCDVLDPRAWTLVERMRAAKLDTSRIQAWLSDNWAAMVPPAETQGGQGKGGTAPPPEVREHDGTAPPPEVREHDGTALRDSA